MDLKSFQDSRPNTQSFDNVDKGDLKKTAEQYAQKSDSDLLGEIMKTASQGKRDGSLTAESLQSFAQNVAPLLNEEQRKRLQSVLDMINKA